MFVFGTDADYFLSYLDGVAVFGVESGDESICPNFKGIAQRGAQAGGILSPMNSESIACQSLADKGKTAVIALMDDVVTDIILW